ATAAERRREREAWGSGRTVAAAHATFRSVWFRNSLRGATGLALAVAVVEVTNVEHGFWVILGTLSVLRSNALGTGANVVRAMAGTVVGFVVGSAIMLGLGGHTDLLWAVLPVAVLVSAIAPTAISFSAGQAAFTVVVVVLFNIIDPIGWRVGLTRIEDVAIGCSVSLAVCVLFWPRGAAPALGRALCDAYASGSDYLQRAVERTTSVVDDVDTETARLAGEGPYRRLDDAFRQYVAERGAKPVPPAVAAHLVTGAFRTRVAAYSLGTLPRRPVDAVAAPLPSVTAAGDALRQAAEGACRWYHAVGDVLAGRSVDVPPVHRHREDLHRLLVEAFRDASGRRRAGDVRAVLRMLWADESLEDELALRRDLSGAAGGFARRPTLWNRF
ncbi:MAG: FUSC family protein, partial [Acidimicrobiales bacterium]